MDRILTEGRTVIVAIPSVSWKRRFARTTWVSLCWTSTASRRRVRRKVKAAFDDAIAARENEQQYIREAEAYTNEVQPRANGQAQRILEEARAYKTRTVLEAEVKWLALRRSLPEYKAAPEITRERLYIETMEKVLSHTRKVLVNDSKTAI